MHIGSTASHADASTASSFLNLDDRTVQIQLTQGSLYIRIRYMADDDVYEVDTPNGAISLLRTGTYRIDVDPDRQTNTETQAAGPTDIFDAWCMGRERREDDRPAARYVSRELQATKIWTTTATGGLIRVPRYPRMASNM